MAESKPIIKSIDMRVPTNTNAGIMEGTIQSEELQEYIINKVKEINDTEGNKSDKEIAALLKKDLDQNYEATWHVIVGKDFGSYVSHEAGKFIYFYINEKAYMIFKTY